jgi:lipoyl(octanoyl) transferase
MSIEIRWLGRVGYEDALELQEKLVAEKNAARSLPIRDPQSAIRNSDTLFLLEHEPVYTIGRTRDQSSLGNRDALPHPVIEINRGGQATWHGPGQLVGYPILDLQNHGRDLHRYLRALENVLIETLSTCGIDAQQRDGLTGVWVGEKKIASIGVGVRHWITMHGFALNVCGDLAAFSHITPCGIAGVEITSIERETGASVDVKSVAHCVAEIFVARFDEMIANKTH